ncbi:hypothetical protein [Erysipelothrix aquatica]|uniref:hypothetical protein n=1 Tax=Erysipelothrix aquatica TaxID=2683714 RepID=UPI001357667A|nr:hypothetical protein [Erysipelothrix aquatica]
MRTSLKKVTLFVLSTALVVSVMFMGGTTTSINAEETKKYTTTVNSGDVLTENVTQSDVGKKEPSETEEALKENFEDKTTEIEISVAETPNEESVLIEDLEVTSETRVLKENEVIVSSYDEFHAYVTNRGNGIYDTYIMNDDFLITKALTVPSGYSFILDGKDPVTNENHSLTAPANDDFFNLAIKARDNKETTMHFKNMTITSNGKYGLMYSSYENTTFIYENVNFYGTTLAQNTKGTSILHNVSATMASRYGQELIRSKTIIFRGETLIRGLSNNNSTTFNTADSNLIFEEYSQTTIQTDYRAIYANSIVMKRGANLDIEVIVNEGASALTIVNVKALTIENASLNVIIDETTRTSAIISADEFAMNHANVNIKGGISWQPIVAKNRVQITNESQVMIDSVYVSGGIIDQTESTTPYDTGILIENSTIVANVGTATGNIIAARKDIVINDSTLELNADKIDRNAINTASNLTINRSTILADSDNPRIGSVLVGKKFTVNDSDILVDAEGKVPTSSRYYMITAKDVEFVNARIELYLNDMEYVGIFDVANSITIADEGMKPSWFVAEANHKVDLINKAKTPIIEINSQQINVWNEVNATGTPDYKIYNSDNRMGTLKFSINKDGSIKIYTNTFENENGLMDIKAGTFTEHAIYAIGHIAFSNQANDDLSVLNIKTNPNAEIVLNYNKTEQLQGTADADGQYFSKLDQPLSVDYHTITITDGRFQIVEVLDYTIYGSVDLVNYPSSIQFGSIDIKNAAGTHHRDEAMTLRVEDTRYERTGWKLEVRAKQEMTDTAGRGSTLNNSLIFKNNSSHNGNAITNKPIVVYETPDQYDAVTELQFDQDLGVLLELTGANGIYANAGYTAELEWILTFN